MNMRTEIHSIQEKKPKEIPQEKKKARNEHLINHEGSQDLYVTDIILNYV